MGNLTVLSFGLICIAVTLGGFGQVFLKMGLGQHGIASGQSVVGTVLNIFFAMLKPKVLIGLLFYIVSTFFWLTALSRVRLSVAYPLISISYPLVVVLSATILHEPVRWAFAVAGLLFITLGVSFIGLGLGRNKVEAHPCKD